MKRLIVAVAVTFIVTVSAVSASTHTAVAAIDQPVIPACQEDAVLLGQGEFTAGRWSDYVCGPSEDDLVFPYVSPPPGAQGE